MQISPRAFVMPGVKAFSVLILSLFLTQGCRSLLSPPSVRIVGVELVAVGLTEGVAEVTLEVANEGLGALNVMGILYELEVNTAMEGLEWKTLSNGIFDDAITIPQGRIERVKIPVTFQYLTVGQAIRALLARGEVPYRLSGEVWVGGTDSGLQVPFRMQGILEP